MPTSLKLFLPSLGECLGYSVGALYERQRALVGLGLLHSVSGRGPGSGVRLAPGAAATMICCLLATDNLSETGEWVRELCESQTSKVCKLTGERKFQAALTKVLSSREIAWAVESVHADRDRAEASITFYRGRVFRTYFSPRRKKSFAPISTSAWLHRDALRALVQELHKEIT